VIVFRTRIPADPSEHDAWLAGKAALAPMLRIGRPAEIVDGGAMVRCFAHSPIGVG